MSTDRFNLPCPGCGTAVAVSMAHVGKKGRCPQCKTVFPISAPAAADAAVMADLMPLSPSNGLQPLSAGLQPLAAGLQPLQPMQQPWQPAPQPAWPGAQPQQPAWQGAALPNPYGQSGTPATIGQPAFGQPASPFGQPSSPFGQPARPNDDEFRLSPDANNPYAAPSAPNAYVQDALNAATQSNNWKREKDSGDINSSLWGGIGMMALAVVWFFGALFLFDLLFIYPPILFIIGLVAFIKGLMNLGSG